MREIVLKSYGELKNKPLGFILDYDWFNARWRINFVSVWLAISLHLCSEPTLILFYKQWFISNSSTRISSNTILLKQDQVSTIHTQVLLSDVHNLLIFYFDATVRKFRLNMKLCRVDFSFTKKNEHGMLQLSVRMMSWLEYNSAAVLDFFLFSFWIRI